MFVETYYENSTIKLNIIDESNRNGSIENSNVKFCNCYNHCVAIDNK